MRNKSVGMLLVAFALSFAVWSAGCGAAANSSAVDPGSLSGTPTALVKAPGDWGMSLLNGGTVGVGMFPAKFTFDVSATPSCANDYVAMNTSLTGAAQGTAQQTVTFGGTGGSGTPAGTVIITNGANTLTLTAAANNTGNNFLVTQDNTLARRTANALSLANRIVALGGPAGVTASSAAGVTTITAATPGVAGDSITLTGTLNGSNGVAFGGATFTGGAGAANVLAFNNLYATQGSVGGLCNQDGPSFYWSYVTGTGQALTSVVLSGDGSKVAFVENGTGATLRILKWKAGEGAAANGPVAPTTTLTAGQNWTSNCPAANSCLSSIAFNGGFQDTGSSPFYDYNNDVLYVGDDSSRMHKFTGVFLGTPTEVTTGWPITVSGTTNLTAPVYDGVSKNIFVGTDGGSLFFIKEVGSTTGACAAGVPPCLGSVSLPVGTAGAIVDAPVVDGTTGRVIVVNGTETSTNRGTILQASTALTGSVTFKIGGGAAGSRLYSGAFDNTYINSNMPTIAGHMYVCGKDSAFNDRPAIYQMSFAAATGILTGVGTPLTGITNASGEACSPVTEFFNPNGGGAGVPKDWIFFSIGDNANNAAPIPVGACRTGTVAGQGCVLSADVTGNPTWPPASLTASVAVPTNVNGGTSGMVVDNTSASAQASSFYFTLGTNSIGTGPGTPSCNTTAGVGCAVKLTQLGLQ